MTPTCRGRAATVSPPRRRVRRAARRNERVRIAPLSYSPGGVCGKGELPEFGRSSRARRSLIIGGNAAHQERGLRDPAGGKNRRHGGVRHRAPGGGGPPPQESRPLPLALTPPPRDPPGAGSFRAVLVPLRASRDRGGRAGHRRLPGGGGNAPGPDPSRGR